MVTRREFLERAATASAGLALLGACSPFRSGTSLVPTGALPARAGSSGGDLSLDNDAIAARWRVEGGAFRALGVRDVRLARDLDVAPAAFTLTLADGRVISADAMRVVSGPRIETLAPAPHASRFAERVAGRQITVVLEDAAGTVRATWHGVLRDGSPYVRQEIRLEALREPVAIRQIALVDLHAPRAAVNGTVKGSPVVADTWYAGFEHPLSVSHVDDGRARGVLTRELPLRPGAPVTASSVIGTTRPGQLRRDFLTYVERERAHPYRTFLHYNSWYDIGYFSPYDEADALVAINAFGQNLVRARNVVMSSFLFDDGWDDHDHLWRFSAGFPHGFTPLREAAARYGAAPGVWFSPWGGYGKPRQERLAAGKAAGFEENKGGFELSGPKYYARVEETCLSMVRHYGVNQFKIDGTGNTSNAFPGSVFDSDFDAAIALIGELRTVKPDLYINLTTGTYPSPFWLRYADSIWRGGEDHSFAGVGTDRQQWITYRDGDTFRGIVSKGPLFPLNSLMLHGMIYARHANKLSTDPGNDFTSEARAYFGTGTQLQEMYITPALLTPANWDAIAEAAKWSRAHMGTLVDTHWVGGDPRHLEAYGHAAWSAANGGAVLCLRNPSDKPQSLTLDVARALELPEGAAARFTARSPWAEDAGRPPVTLEAGRSHDFALAPFEVLTLDLASSS